MSLKKLAFALFLLLSAMASQAQLITTFGSSATNGGFTWDYDPNTSTISGTEGFGDLIYGTPETTSLLGSSVYISLTGSATVIPAGSFNIVLEDSSANLASATFLWSSFGSGPQTVQAALVFTTFDFSDVAGWALVSGASLQPVDASFSQMSAVPEPSAVLLLGGTAIYFLGRRTRVALGI
jgi:hypothetical protein